RAEGRTRERSPQKRTWPARPRAHPNLVYCRLKLGWGRGKTRAITSILLAACHLTFLHSTGGGRNLLKSPHAARGWHLSMGQNRVQRICGLHRGMECLATLHHGHRAWGDVCYDQHLLRHRRKRGLDAEQQMVRVIA